ncbi:alpha-1B adrenergic receptor-like [Diadema antillarum]|uniref:alpha-1B adrenergic receptor-like n=1 Tax=Diadema antillarum TaxID=105358 RepID=UPI003A84D97E
MTLADLVVGAVIMPLRSSIELYGTWIFGRIFGVIFMTLQNASLGISVMGVVVITIDRYIATLHPLTHFTKKSRRLAIIINVLTWVLPFTLWFFLNAVWDLVSPNSIEGPNGRSRSLPSFADLEKSCVWVRNTFCLEIQDSTCGGSGHSAPTLKNDFITMNCTGTVGSEFYGSNTIWLFLIMLSLALITVVANVFAVTWVPNVINIVLYSMSRCYDTVTTTALFNEISRWITYSNSLFNPVAYALAQPLIRQTVARMLCSGCGRSQEGVGK